MKNYCLDCKKEIGKKSKYCGKCYTSKHNASFRPEIKEKHRKNAIKNKKWQGENNPSYLKLGTAKKYFCIGCNKLISYKSKRCITCSNKFEKRNLGKKMSKKQKIKLSLAKGGKGIYHKDVFCSECNKKLHRTAYYYGDKKCAKCAQKDKKKWVGNKNPNFKGRKSKLNELMKSSPFYIRWRKEVYKRDDYSCKNCGDKKGGNLEAHHKKAFYILLDDFLKKV